jgi:hypothetical protein
LSSTKASGLKHQVVEKHDSEANGRYVQKYLQYLKSKCLNFVAYSVAMDESTHATDGADEKIMEELAALVPLKDTKMATDLYSALQNILETCQLKINMSAQTTDGASALLDKKGGVSAMIRKQTQWNPGIMISWRFIVQCTEKNCVQNPSLPLNM